MATKPMTPANGEVCWSEVAAPDAAAAAGFYTGLFGWTAVAADLGGMPYHFLARGGTNFGGVMPARPGVPAHWLVYVAVDDVDATVNRVQSLGGSVVVPGFDATVGRLAVVRDPQGATFGLYRGKA
jgi:uncharacterized protein